MSIRTLILLLILGIATGVCTYILGLVLYAFLKDMITIAINLLSLPLIMEGYNGAS